jgi:hypothetical protein
VAEFGVAIEDDVGALGELANPVAREFVIEIKAGFLDDGPGDDFRDDDERGGGLGRFI